jgi:glyoxylase-like metal-dependent hydrolase (beta-lactamase superfamily II)
MRRATQAAGWSAAAALLLALVGGTPTVGAQQRQAAADGLEVVELRPNFFLIGGPAATSWRRSGPAGVIVVDSGTTDAADRVVAAIRRLTPLAIRYVINTGMDADHVGGNEKLAKAGMSIPARCGGGRRRAGDALLNNGGGPVCCARETS